MAETSITTRALTYRDPSVAAAADAQLRRNRQRALGTLEDQAQRIAITAEETAQQERSKADSYRAAQDSADGGDKSGRSSGISDAQVDQARLWESGTGPTTGDEAAASVRGDVIADKNGQSLAPFTTQMIAQEYIGEGLHVPPLQPADEAYRRAGAEPPLIEESSTSGLVSLAI